MLSENYKNRYFCDNYIDNEITNKKGEDFKSRFIDIISDPNNLLIKRVFNAGEIIDNKFVVMHNGIIVSKNGYYDDFSDILKLNKGCHEPAEERMFAEVLNYIPEGGIMIELGSYWCFYSIWFNKVIKNATNYCIEPDLKNMNVGIENCAINNVVCEFKNSFIGNGMGHLKILEFIKDRNINKIDILHSDIQGYENELVDDIKPLLKNKIIKYLFISTHSNTIHSKCIKTLNECDYRIIASADFENETFCYDGIIVACSNTNLEIENTKLGNRSKTKLRNIPYEFETY